MLFTSNVFVQFFLPLLLAVYFLMPRCGVKGKNVILLVFSMIFYAFGGIRHFFLLLLSILINYLGGLGVGLCHSNLNKKICLWISVTANLIMIGVFKYAGFASSILKNLGVLTEVVDIALPIGISFFTFQGLSYVVDVYRGDTPAQKNPLNVALYVSLFPQLVAGPIVRYTDIEKEIIQRGHSTAEVSDGLVRFMLGFGKKMLIANPMGLVADEVFALTGSALLTTPLAWVGAIAYTMQIYFDFSAYSDMAIGLGKIFGFHFNENFNYPYIALSITDFWRRWHISLSTWFRDYVYIPLGGNRCSIARQVFNLAVVWVLTGLWHGASWNFIAWGTYYGLLLILEKFVLHKLLPKIPKWLRHIFTLFIVVVGWVFFRAATLKDGVEYLGVMFGGASFDVSSAVYYLLQFAPEFICAVIGIFPLRNLLADILDKYSEKKGVFVLRAVWPKVFAVVVFILSYTALVSGSFNPFIYFQF
jgi:D-alanyl-lipoteichoic acid acyltransferase DltB (MBOAT superfamily)